MKAAIVALCAAALLTAPRVARADDAAPFLWSGGLLTGLGAATLATTPLCKVSIIRETAQPSCLVTSLVSGGVLAAVGVPLLVVGVRRRAPPVEVQPVTGGVVVSWSGRW